MNNDTLKVILHDEVQTLLDNFAGVIHAQVMFYNSDGEPLCRGRNEGNCQYCQMVQKHLFSLQECLKLDQEKLALCRKTRRSQVYMCHAQLYEAIMPVVSNGELLGFIVFGQIRSTDNLSPEFLEANQGKINLNNLKQAFMEQPCLDAKAMENLLGLMELLVDYIVRHELITPGGDQLYRAIIKYIDENLTAELNIKTLARRLGRSVSTVSHFLKKHCGKSFKTLIIEKRLNKADQIWKEHPDWSVGEVAESTGINDRYYFSRIYKKYRGYPPTRKKR